MQAQMLWRTITETNTLGYAVYLKNKLTQN